MVALGAAPACDRFQSCTAVDIEADDRVAGQAVVKVDGDARAGVTVDFLVNGDHVADAKTDGSGVAVATLPPRTTSYTASVDPFHQQGDELRKLCPEQDAGGVKG